MHVQLAESQTGITYEEFTFKEGMSYKKLITVPFFPICHGSRGWNNIKILQQNTEEKYNQDIIFYNANYGLNKGCF